MSAPSSPSNQPIATGAETENAPPTRGADAPAQPPHPSSTRRGGARARSARPHTAADASAVLLAVRAADFTATHIAEPSLIFGDNLREVDPKTGLALHGPFDLRSAARRTSIRLGIIGTGPMIDAALTWVERAQGRVPAVRLRKAKGGGVEAAHMDPVSYPPFPGLREAFGTEVVTEGMVETLGPRDIASLERIELFEPRVTRLVDLVVERVRVLADRDPAPDVILCALPTEIRKLVTVPSRQKTRAKAPRTLAQELSAALARDRAAGQDNLFDVAEVHGVSSEALDPEAEQSVFRHGLKARAMPHGIPLQLAWQTTFEGGPSVEDDATRAWNFWAGVYYKAGGVPWRVHGLERGTCYVGLSFYRDRRDGTLRTCMAQAFSDQGEGLVLRSEPFRWDPSRRSRSPHLPEDLARDLMQRVLDAYQAATRQLPSRVVLHKWQRYDLAERSGFVGAIEGAGVHTYDLVAFGSRGLRFFRTGGEPPLRGTMITVAPGNALLYTRGYVPFLREYPGMRVPRPLEVVEHHGGSALLKLGQEIMALTKLDWNSATFAAKEPITTAFSDDVGEVLAELPPGVSPRPQYRFYM